MPVTPLLQCLEQGEGGFPLPPKQALEQVIESPPSWRALCLAVSVNVFIDQGGVSTALPCAGHAPWCRGRRGRGIPIPILLFRDQLSSLVP